MSAEVLRRAAALMRERAEASADWNWTSGVLWVVDYDPSDPSGQTAMQRPVGGADAPWGDHIASWHPAVALAVADWLDHAAESCGLNRAPYVEESHEHALAAALAYLGEDA